MITDAFVFSTNIIYISYSDLNLTVVNVVQQRGRVFVGQRTRGELFPSTLVHGKEPTVG